MTTQLKLLDGAFAWPELLQFHSVMELEPLVPILPHLLSLQYVDIVESNCQGEDFRQGLHLIKSVYEMPDAASDVLVQIFKATAPVDDGDVASKSGRDYLLEHGFLVKVYHKQQQGYQALTYLGGTAYRLYRELQWASAAKDVQLICTNVLNRLVPRFVHDYRDKTREVLTHILLALVQADVNTELARLQHRYRMSFASLEFYQKVGNTDIHYSSVFEYQNWPFLGAGVVTVLLWERSHFEVGHNIQLINSWLAGAMPYQPQ